MKKLILIIAFLLMPGLCFAGSLTPNWTTMTALTSGTVFYAGTQDLGTIDMSGKYVVEIHANVVETGSNPTGTGGVSIFLSGGTEGQVPATVWSIDAITFKDALDGTGVTKTFVFENVREITVGAGRDNAADAWTATIYYRTMSGTYID